MIMRGSMHNGQIGRTGGSITGNAHTANDVLAGPQPLIRS